MSIHHRRIPVLPERPRGHPIAGHISRSYPVGRQNFSRAFQGKNLALAIVSEDPLPDSVRVRLKTTVNSPNGKAWVEVPFARDSDRSLVCNLLPRHSGLYSFRAEFSLDMGSTWVTDTVPDAWILVDPPNVDALRIYTLIPNVSGTLADWKDSLKRIRDMGFNAIHLLPVTTLDKSESPYAAKDLFDIDQRYLIASSHEDGLSQLEEFAEEARALNIRLCFDLVLNHVGVTSTMALRAPDWIVPDQDQADGFKRAGYWSGQGWSTWDDLVLINYEHPSEAIRSEIRAYMIDYALFWAKYASETGGFVRFDNLHSSDAAFIQELSIALHAEFPEVGILAEYFTDERTLLNTIPGWGLNLVLATPWNYKYVPELREYLKYIHRLSEQVRYFMPITTHDSGAPAQEFGSLESTIPRYVAAALLGTGATGIPMGLEFGELERIDFIGRKPKMEFPSEARFGQFIRHINSILVEYSAFQCGKNCQFVDDGHEAIVAVFRSDSGPQSSGFLVLCNFDIAGAQSIKVDLTTMLGSTGPFAYCDLISGESQRMPEPIFEIHLAPCQAQVLKFIRSPDPVDNRRLS